MDFGFAPDGDAHVANLRPLFGRRPTTSLIDIGGVNTVKQFITHLEKPPITKPVGDLLIGAHANNEGEFFIPMFPGQRGSTKYETLEESLKNTTKSIKVDTIIGFKAGDPITHSVHIKGCNLGQALPSDLRIRLTVCIRAQLVQEGHGPAILAQLTPADKEISHLLMQSAEKIGL